MKIIRICTEICKDLFSRLNAPQNSPPCRCQRFRLTANIKIVCRSSDTWTAIRYHNGAPLPAAHRFRPMFDFGYVALDILYAYPEDSGTYTLVARNELGEAQCTLELVVNSSKTLYLDANHPEGLQRIQVTPVHDPTMVVEWFVDGRQLITGSRVKTLNEFGFVALDIMVSGQPILSWRVLIGHRFRTFYDFGFVSLDILGVYAQDSGEYTCKAENALGSVETKTRIHCSREFLGSFHLFPLPSNLFLANALNFNGNFVC
ncbi:immunoglobulin I-set domain protein [Ancylostoma duodenale]|uniref:Immunoglobulin I-set domain protein n=1 Tax=Ancylostoma duodenale TaxID=51022 RepID=A0A0C2GKR5_9BILA|nr:immunoglobulin I-set domain protein [Ancylostoma duodenale]